VMMSACGVMCSECPAHLAAVKGVAHQQRTAEAWHRIYGQTETVENISCGGCLGTDDELFHTSRRCKARQCCRRKGFVTCAQCPHEACSDLEQAQALWDEVPSLAATLSPEDFARYARAYIGHRERLAAARVG
jgi:hypothetical protein